MGENICAMSKNIYDCKFESMEKYLDFKDVLILPKKSNLNSRKEVNLERKIYFQNGLSWTGIPIIAANMTTTGTLELYKVLSAYKIITALHKFHNLQDLLDYNNENSDSKLNPDYFMISTGISDDDYTKLISILDNFECKFICVDIANGYISKFGEFCKKLRSKYPEKIIVAGNVCTYEGINMLNELEIDIVKVGIGGGSACTTRIQTGIGMPQLSCVLECVEECQAYNQGCFIIYDEYDAKIYKYKDNNGNMLETINLAEAKKGEILEEILIVDYLAEHYQKYSTKLNIVSNKSAEGTQFANAFKIGGICKYMYTPTEDDYDDLDEFDDFM